MPTTPSPLRYPGGKTVYTPMLRRIIQDNGLDGCDYAEPFAGGAGAAISLALSGVVNRIWLNDLDLAIYAFWKAVIEHPDDLAAAIWNTGVSVSEWKRQRKIFRDERDDLFKLGFAAFYLNRCNRAGILAANPIGGLRPIKNASKYRINARFDKRKMVQKIHAIAAIGGRVRVSNLDARDFIKTLPSRIGKTLVYFDPPYFKKGCLLYLNSFSESDHRALSRAILKCKHKWILSYDDHPCIRRLYSGVQMYERRLNYSVATPSIGKELIISPLRILPPCLNRVEAIGSA